MIYQIKVHGQPTIFYEDVVSVKADSPEEAKAMAQEAFREILNERFGWVDIDTIFTEELKCQ